METNFPWTKHPYKVHCLVPVRIRLPIYLNYNAFASFYTHLIFFVRLYYVAHVSFEDLKSEFEVVLVNDAMSHALNWTIHRREIQLFCYISNSRIMENEDASDT